MLYEVITGQAAVRQKTADGLALPVHDLPVQALFRGPCIFGHVPGLHKARTPPRDVLTPRQLPQSDTPRQGRCPWDRPPQAHWTSRRISFRSRGFLEPCRSREETFDAGRRKTRITSYNVCYTKLLRDKLRLDLPKGQLASLLGTIPETLSRVLKKMTEAGYIAVDGNDIEVANAEGLETLAQGLERL